jgi:hypothetical protein
MVDTTQAQDNTTPIQGDSPYAPPGSIDSANMQTKYPTAFKEFKSMQPGATDSDVAQHMTLLLVNKPNMDDAGLKKIADEMNSGTHDDAMRQEMIRGALKMVKDGGAPDVTSALKKLSDNAPTPYANALTSEGNGGNVELPPGATTPMAQTPPGAEQSQPSPAQTTNLQAPPGAPVDSNGQVNQDSIAKSLQDKGMTVDQSNQLAQQLYGKFQQSLGAMAPGTATPQALAAAQGNTNQGNIVSSMFGGHNPVNSAADLQAQMGVNNANVANMGAANTAVTTLANQKQVMDFLSGKLGSGSMIANIQKLPINEQFQYLTILKSVPAFAGIATGMLANPQFAANVKGLETAATQGATNVSKAQEAVASSNASKDEALSTLDQMDKAIDSGETPHGFIGKAENWATQNLPNAVLPDGVIKEGNNLKNYEGLVSQQLTPQIQNLMSSGSIGRLDLPIVNTLMKTVGDANASDGARKQANQRLRDIIEKSNEAAKAKLNNLQTPDLGSGKPAEPVKAPEKPQASTGTLTHEQVLAEIARRKAAKGQS